MTPARQRTPELSAQQFHILLALADEDRHGYGIILEVARRTSGAVRLGTGPLYTAIGRLAAAGLIEETSRRDADDARRRYYTLTTSGRQTLRLETARFEGLLAQARRKGIRSAAKGRA
ncbi:MAG TPA: helix-turn-helix transcriptional regulator [Vicinamibacterales bacterium]|nr:helix-turn-helix transcriptional regulator [Vicinamibacterales bacterium]